MRSTGVRALPVALIAVVAAMLALPSPAEAAVTSSNITSPANGSRYLTTNASPTGNVTVTGTSNGTTGDFVDIRCYLRSDRWQSVDTVEVAANGSFSTTMSKTTPYGTCRLRAVPQGLPKGSPLGAFTGPQVTTEEITTSVVTAGPNLGKVYDYYVQYQSPRAMNDYVSATHGGIWDSRLTYADGTSSNYLWYGAAGLTRDEDGARSQIQVDGRNAYGPFSARQVSQDAPGLPQLTFSTGRSASGVTTIRESNPLVFCPNGIAYPPTPATCTQFSTSGVRLERTIVTDDLGRQVHITDVWRSTDGKAHTISAHYQEWVEGYTYEGVGASTPVSVRLPWLGGYQTYTVPTTFAGPAKAPSTIFVRDHNSVANGNVSFPRGAITSDVGPNAVRREGNAGFRRYDNAIKVPAKGTAVVRHDYVMGTSEAEIGAKAAASVVRLNPFRSDALIKRKAAAVYAGNGRYNTTAAGQTVLAKAKRSRVATFLVAVQNDGTRATSFKIKGTGAKAGFTVAYLKGATGKTAITRSVTRGTYLLRNLAPGAIRVIRLVVKVKPGMRIGAVRSWLVLATSTSDATSKDAVKAKVRVIK